MRMSVDSRSPTITQSAASTPSPARAASSMAGSGLPVVASQVTPVQASMAAMMAPQSGSPRPPGRGQYLSGLVATSRARRWNQMASKAIWSFS
jgi:hypothetical protein